jgi:hypothetical protein
MSSARTSLTTALLSLAMGAASAGAQVTPPAGQPAQQPPATGAEATAPGNAAARRGPHSYAQVITARAHTEKGGITVHKVDDRYFFEVPDSLMGRDFLMVT